MSVMRCLRCMRQVDLDYHCEDWDDERDMCRFCAEAEEELQRQHMAAQAAEGDSGT